MKKILFSIAALAVAFGFTACSNEDETLSVKGGKTTVLAMTEVGTRTALESDGEGAYNVVWSEGDKIYLGNGHSEYYEFELKSGAGETTATFEATGEGTNKGEVPADGNYKVYYGSQYDTFESTQHYEAGKVSNFQMCASATVTDGKISPIQFWNVGGILRLTVKGTATIKNIKVTSEQPMSGPSSFNNETKTATASDHYSIKKVTLDCGDGVALTSAGTVFNIALLANTYTGVQITLTDADGNTLTKTFNGTDGLKIERSKITKASFTASFPAPTTGTAKRTGDVDVKWVQLWKDGPKFAEYNVDGTITFTDAMTSTDYVWGANWRTPSKDEIDELVKAASSTGSTKVTCKYEQVGGVWGFTFVGKEEGYTENSVFLPVMAGYEQYGTANYWSGTADGAKGWSVNLLYDEHALCSKWNSDNQSETYFVRPVLNEAPPAPATKGKAYAKDPDCDVNWVQLWTNGPKFAEYNVGAELATQIGGYYTWGGTYKNGTGITWSDDHNKTNDGTGNLAIADDTAYNLWGENWRMPTKEEFEALIANCDAEWTADYNNSGLKGTIYTGKDNYSENSIFIPVAGYCEEGKFKDVDDGPAYYWSSTPYTSEGALFLCFDKTGAAMELTSRDYGFPIRPVLNETK